MRSSAILRGFSFGVLLTVGWTQNYLAKKESTSKLYWRNNPLLAETAFQTAHLKYIDRSIGLFKLLSGAGFNFSELKVTLQMLKQLQQLKHMFDKVDDKVDGSRPEAILMLGDAELGKDLNFFLRSVLNDKDLLLIDQLTNQGLISKTEIVSFGNLLANKLHQQAVLTLKYETERDAKQRAVLREQIAAENMELSGVYFALVVHLARKDNRIAEAVATRPLDYETVAQIYPTPVKAGKLMQVAHDSIEFRYDLRQELVIGKVSANCFLAKLEEEKVLSQEKIRLKLKELPHRAVSVYELPQDVQTVFSKVEQRYFKESEGLGMGASIIYKLAWRYKSGIGFFYNKPAHESEVTPSTLKRRNNDF